MELEPLKNRLAVDIFPRTRRPLGHTLREYNFPREALQAAICGAVFSFFQGEKKA